MINSRKVIIKISFHAIADMNLILEETTKGDYSEIKVTIDFRSNCPLNIDQMRTLILK